MKVQLKEDRERREGQRRVERETKEDASNSLDLLPNVLLLLELEDVSVKLEK